MQKKPILIITGVLAIAICSFLFIRSKYLVKPEKKEVIAFLEGFNLDLKMSNTDTLLNYFDGKKNNKILIKLLGILSNKTASDGKTKPLFEVALVPDESIIKIINPEITQATVPIIFVDSGNVKQHSSIQFKLRKISEGHFKIIQFDGRGFINDLVAYENKIQIIDGYDKVVYSPITLEAFKTAQTLRTKYDSVIWFAHLDAKTYYYVVKGKWDEEKDINRYQDSIIEPYGIGLVSPELKEIIPPQFDLIYNINGTFPGLVEVEKDNKKGFYNLDGKNVVPVEFDQILPLNDKEELALLRKGSDYFYLEKDLIISNRVDINVGDYLPKIKDLNTPSDLNKKVLEVVTEYNSKQNHGAIYITPSYLSDLNIISKFNEFKNPLRKGIYEDVHTKYEVKPTDSQKENGNWIASAFYSIRDYFLGGRGEFYDTKRMVLADKKSNRLYAAEFGTDYSPDGSESLTDGTCDINSIKALTDSLLEVKTGVILYVQLYDSTKDVVAGPYYHYLKIKDNKLIELPGNRNFGFTKYVKMDDSYLDACYQIQNYQIQKSTYKNSNIKTVDHITPEMLRYMKNEIYASYCYKFKDKRWQDVFSDMVSAYDHGNEIPPNANVDDSLTVIDKYNINFINQKLNGVKSPLKVLAAK